MSDIDQRNRLVFLGAGGVGKSAIIRRFLQDSFLDQYKETVEDLYCKEYDCQGTLVKVDILDTAGNFAFPAMRRLSISTAHAFVLVYSVNNYPSFHEVQRLREEIKEQRSNYEDLPCVVVGNKIDLDHERQVRKEDAIHWVYDCGLNGAFVEVSAKRGENILDIFKMLLDQAKGSNMKKLEPLLRRRLSANAVEESETAGEKLEKEPTIFSRSRSLIRRGSKPKMKRTGRTKAANRNECVIS